MNAATGGERALGPFLEMDLDGFQGSFKKLWGYVNSVRLGAAHMSEDGAIVLVSGYPARRPGPGAITLSTVGNAVEGFVRAAAAELAPRRINAVCPGLIDTPMFPGRDKKARAEHFAKATAKHLLPRIGGRGRSGGRHFVRHQKRLRHRHHGGCGRRRHIGLPVVVFPHAEFIGFLDA